MKQLVSLILTFAVAALPAAAKVKVRRQQSLARWHITPANYSGLTPLGNDRYAVVDDKSPTDGFHIFTIRLNPHTGKIVSVSSTPLLGNPDGSPKADCEDIALCPQDSTLFIAQERACKVGEYRLDGRPTGRQLQLPPYFSLAYMQNNLGFESLAYSDSTRTLYLTTEQPLKGETSNRIVAFNTDLQPADIVSYTLDPPELKHPARYYAHGICAMTILSFPSRLLIMERELSIPRRYVGGKCRIKIYEIEADTTENHTQLSIPDTHPPKRLLTSFTTHISRLNYANYEGMCPGPTLADGRSTLLLLSDSQAGAHNGPFHLKDYLKVIILDR